jgi:hypothetical protein
MYCFLPKMWYTMSMNIEEIKQLVEKELGMDPTELGDESIRIPKLHAKFLNIFHDESLTLRKYESEYRLLRKRKWEYYNGKMSQEELKELGWEPFAHRILRQDMDIYMDADPDISKLSAKMELQKAKVDYLDATIKSINNRQWVIRNAIEWKKFMSGVT